MDIAISNKKVSYSIGKMMKQLLKRRKQSSQKINSMESLENESNASLEVDYLSMESNENDINEHLSAKQSFFDEEINTVPVHYIRTAEGTFFWTSSANQISCLQDRWAQA
ncbi:enhancer of split m4 protein-like [Haematobia irritans]|uniref:enhancer of split m4 protein-like n=1 Tax=Haematobia irritans TaxID=7368 RepID=UPI003F4FA88F